MHGCNWTHLHVLDVPAVSPRRCLQCGLQTSQYALKLSILGANVQTYCVKSLQLVYTVVGLGRSQAASGYRGSQYDANHIDYSFLISRGSHAGLFKIARQMYLLFQQQTTIERAAADNRMWGPQSEEDPTHLKAWSLLRMFGPTTCMVAPDSRAG